MRNESFVLLGELFSQIARVRRNRKGRDERDLTLIMKFLGLINEMEISESISVKDEFLISVQKYIEDSGDCAMRDEIEIILNNLKSGLDRLDRL